MRTATVERKTRETEIAVSLDLDGTGDSDIDTGIGFLDHMLESFSRHSMIDLKVRATGDLHVDYHHTTEDTAIVIGQAVKQALGDFAGITRFGSALIPMDEALTRAALVLPKRPHARGRGRDCPLLAAYRQCVRRQHPWHRRGLLGGSGPRAPPDEHGR